MELLDSSLVSTDCKIKGSQIIIAVQSGKKMEVVHIVDAHQREYILHRYVKFGISVSG